MHLHPVSRFIAAAAAICAPAVLASCADPPSQALSTGAACTLDAQCASALCLTADAGWPDGVCTAACTGSCGDGLACVPLTSGSLCLPACAASTSCRPGWVCSPDAAACLPDCRGGWSCGALACDDATGLCALPRSPGGSGGAPCTADPDCVAGACVGEGAPGSLCAGPCASDGACGDGSTCVRLGDYLLCLPSCGAAPCGQDQVCSPTVGACLPDCRAGFACGDALICGDDGACRLPEAPGALVGQACASDLDCEGGVCLEASDEAGGACAAGCAAGECPGGQVCARLGENLLCVAACDSTSPCEGGHVCSPPLGGCVPDCRAGWSCGSLSCDGDTGLCALPSAPPGGTLGSPCESSTDCATLVCVREVEDGASTGWKGGMCVSPCVDDACEDGGRCVVLDGEALCLPACAGGCRDGYVCSPPLDACLPDCRLGWDCGDGYVCGPAGLCGVPHNPGAPLGAPCESGAGCDSGVCFAATGAGGQATGWEGGTCAAPCGNASCGAASSCVVLDSVSWCLPSCTPGSCRAGYVCSSDLKACLPDCRLGWDCGDVFTCSDDGECRIELPTLLPLGAACDTQGQCATGACMLPPQGASVWPYGVCTQPCGAGCPSGTACAPLGANPVCLPSCADGCSAGYVCAPQGGACVPSCLQGWPCPPGVPCNQQGLCGAQGPGPGGP